MNDEQRELARRLAAHPKWEWRQGMMGYIPGWGPAFMAEDELGGPSDYPLLEDPCTQGWLMRMIADATPNELDLTREPPAGGSGPHLWECTVYDDQPVNGDCRARDVSCHSARDFGEALARVLLDVWGES